MTPNKQTLTLDVTLPCEGVRRASLIDAKGAVVGSFHTSAPAASRCSALAHHLFLLVASASWSRASLLPPQWLDVRPESRLGLLIADSAPGCSRGFESASFRISVWVAATVSRCGVCVTHCEGQRTRTVLTNPVGHSSAFFSLLAHWDWSSSHS